MRVKAKRVKDGFLIPALEGYEDKDEIELEIIILPPKAVRFSPEFIKNNWKSLIMTRIDSSNYFKSPEYFLERTLYYEENKFNE